MVAPSSKIAGGLRRAGMAACLVALWGCAHSPPVPATGAVATPAVPAGQARIWVYRDYEPYETLARPYIRLNGAIVGISEPGGAMYRDVPPGSYHVTVDTRGYDVNQFADVNLAAGRTVFLKVESLRFWRSGGRDGHYGDTFYTRLMPPEIAQAEVARAPFYGGG